MLNIAAMALWKSTIIVSAYLLLSFSVFGDQRFRLGRGLRKALICPLISCQLIAAVNRSSSSGHNQNVQNHYWSINLEEDDIETTVWAQLMIQLRTPSVQSLSSVFSDQRRIYFCWSLLLKPRSHWFSGSYQVLLDSWTPGETDKAGGLLLGGCC